MTVQDDVYFCLGVKHLLDRDLWPSGRCGAVLVYTSARYKSLPDGRLSRLTGKDLRHMSGACAVAFRRTAAVDLVDYGLCRGWRGHGTETIDDPVKKVGIDAFIGEALSNMAYEVWAYAPSLAEHDGEFSALGHGGSNGARRGLRFPGVDAVATEVAGDYKSPPE
jgi:hypothetical protein